MTLFLSYKKSLRFFEGLHDIQLQVIAKQFLHLLVLVPGVVFVCFTSIQYLLQSSKTASFLWPAENQKKRKAVRVRQDCFKSLFLVLNIYLEYFLKFFQDCIFFLARGFPDHGPEFEAGWSDD